MFDGRPVEFHSPTEAQANGISTIYQEINLVPLALCRREHYARPGADAPAD